MDPTVTDDEIPYIKAFRGTIADYYDGIITDAGMENAMDLLSRDDVATSLGMNDVHSGELAPGETAIESSNDEPDTDPSEIDDAAPIDPGRARRLILKLTGKEARED